MFLKSSKGNINSSVLLTTFLICIAIALGVALFHHYYSPSKYLEYKVSDLSDKLSGVSDFPREARELLNLDKEISYIKLLDRNGVLEESFGNETLGNTERFSINTSNNKTIVLGLKKPTDLNLDTYLLIWSLLIGSVLALLLIIILSMRASRPLLSLEMLEGSLQRIAEGDYTARIDLNTDQNQDSSIVKIYQSFNRMAESLDSNINGDIKEERAEVFETDEESVFTEQDKANGEDLLEDTVQDEKIEEKIMFSGAETGKTEDQPEIHFEQEEFDLREDIGENRILEESLDDEYKEKTEEGDQSPENYIAQESTSDSPTDKDDKVFKPKIVLPQSGIYPKNRNVTVIVAKINDFEGLNQRLESADLGSFLTEYRKSASQIISAYGGVIEALLQDEIVALFNAPDEQTNPELRAVCSAVEVLHELATMAKKRRSEGKEMIAGKIGIGMHSLSYYTETGVPDSVKKVIKEARWVCENASLWKVYITSDLHDLLKGHVDAKEFLFEGDILYSVTGVEQGVVERENFS